MPEPFRILLSSPRASQGDVESVVRALESGWLAPAGPELAEFESDVADHLGLSSAVGLSSGTAALHLALRYLGVGPGDVVLVPTVTFAATAFPVTYLGAVPVFVDIDRSWNLDPDLLEKAIHELGESGKRVAAVVSVDLYGSPADYERLIPLLTNEGIPLVEDAAEALGGTSNLGPLGTFGEASVLSFNGNKIVTCSGGGMLLTNNEQMASKVRYWSTQARDPVAWYEHSEIGFNYRLSNILAALGRSQFSRLELEVRKRRKIREWYRERLSEVAGIQVQEDPPWGKSNAWLTVVTISHNRYPEGATKVREALARSGIESRLIWKPMHQQPVFINSLSFLNGRADNLFRDGLCLPSGSLLSERDVDEISGLIIEQLRN